MGEGWHARGCCSSPANTPPPWAEQLGAGPVSAVLTVMESVWAGLQEPAVWRDCGVEVTRTKVGAGLRRSTVPLVTVAAALIGTGTWRLGEGWGV